MAPKPIKLFGTPYVPVSWGELFDKISILEIKKENVAKDTAMENINKEFGLLNDFISDDILKISEVSSLRSELKIINKIIWDVEDEIRIKEASRDFGMRFINLARKTYRYNDKRASVKRKLNILLKSTIIEEKIY